jgi:hypothetical protein
MIVIGFPPGGSPLLQLVAAPRDIGRPLQELG